MSENVLLAIIALIGAVASPILSIFVSSSLTNYRISRLEDEVRKHNEVIDRTYKLEGDTKLQDEQIKSLSKRLERLEDDHEKCYVRSICQTD